MNTSAWISTVVGFLSIVMALLSDDPLQAATPGSVVRTGTKRQLSERSPEAPDLMAIESSAIFPTDPP